MMVWLIQNLTARQYLFHAVQVTTLWNKTFKQNEPDSIPAIVPLGCNNVIFDSYACVGGDIHVFIN